MNIVAQTQLRLLCIVVAMMLFAGCAATPKTHHGGDDRLELELFVRDATNSEKLFRIEDGDLHFGGGLDARLQKTTWSTPLSESEIAEIMAAIERVGWPGIKPSFSGAPKEQFWRIAVRTQRGFRRFKGRGESEAAQQVHDVLSRISLRRLEGDLERLPKPGRIGQ